jgi:hypothetical protein
MALLSQHGANYITTTVFVLLVYWIVALIVLTPKHNATRPSNTIGSGAHEIFVASEEATVAIVTMMHSPVDLAQWLNHHLKKGISRFYVRLEVEGSPEESADVYLLRSYPQVTLQLGGGGGGGNVSSMEEGMNEIPGQAQMLRQRAWVAEACTMADKDGVDWLAHIDCDELLQTHDPTLSIPVALALEDTRARRQNSRRIQTMVIPNREAVYHRDKLNERSSPHTPVQCFIHADVRDCNKPSSGCASYANGKGIGRVGPFLREAGVHRFRYEGPPYYMYHHENGDDGGDHHRSPKQLENSADEESASLYLIHYESCDFAKYVNKFMMLANSEKIRFPFDYYNDSIAVARSPNCSADNNTTNNNTLAKMMHPVARQHYSSSLALLESPSTTTSSSCRQLFEHVFTKYRIAS